MPTAQDILARKGSLVYAITPDATVLDATHRMNHNKIGALMVMEEGNIVGIFTERDVLRRVVAVEKNPAEMRVRDAMTAELHTCPPTADLEELAETMRANRIRHVPVMEDGVLLGLISIGDINAQVAQRRDQELTYLSEYVYGRA